MTASKDLKKRIRERQATTGESYSTARLHVLGDRMQVLAPKATEASRVEAVVVKTNQGSARVRILDQQGELTFRFAGGAIAPGQIATLLVEKRWEWRGYAYASGTVESARIDIPRLGLIPLGLSGGELLDLRDHANSHRGDEPYSKLWRRLSAEPRRAYELDGLAWGGVPRRRPGG